MLQENNNYGANIRAQKNSYQGQETDFLKMEQEYCMDNGVFCVYV
jgi:hypothetical protein